MDPMDPHSAGLTLPGWLTSLACPVSGPSCG